MENQLQIFENPEFGKVRCYIDNNNTAQFNVEDIGRGLGFTQVKNGIEYVRYETINNYLNQFGYNSFSQQVGKGDYIPENMVYRLAMKAKNETAEGFQGWLADDVVPSIRKHGAYITPSKIDDLLNNPDLIIGLATKLKNEQEQNKVLVQENAVLNQQVAELTSKADYYDIVMNCPKLLIVTEICKDYGMSTQEFNNKLNELGIQYKLNGVWFLYQKYAVKGWAQTVTLYFENKKGVKFTKTQTRWTQKGRYGLYQELKKHGILPLIEQE